MNMNGDSEWNRWRGEQSAVLTMMQNELAEQNKKLERISKDIYILKGKAILLGSLAGGVAAVLVSLILGALVRL